MFLKRLALAPADLLGAGREPAKKITVFFSGPVTKALPCPPQNVFQNFFRASKTVFFLSGQSLIPLLPLSGQDTKKRELFFAASLIPLVTPPLVQPLVLIL